MTFGWPLTLTLLSLTFSLSFDQKLKFPKSPNLLNFLHRFRFRTPFLHLKLQNWSIGTFFIMVSLKTFFKGSSHTYPTSSLHRASVLSLREDVRDILDILAKCNRPSPLLHISSHPMSNFISLSITCEKSHFPTALAATFASSIIGNTKNLLKLENKKI